MREPSEADEQGDECRHGIRRNRYDKFKIYGKLATKLIAVWFIFSLAASALYVFRTDPSRPPLPLGLAVLTPIVLFLCWFARSEKFREFALALNPRILTVVQAWRIIGFVFLVLYTYGIPPWYVRIARWVGRYRHRSDCPVRGNEPCQSRSPEGFHRVAGAWNFRSSGGSGPRHDCRAVQPARDRNQGDDCAAAEPDSDLCRAAAADLARDLHCSSSSVAPATVLSCRGAIAILCHIGMAHKASLLGHISLLWKRLE